MDTYLNYKRLAYVILGIKKCAYCGDTGNVSRGICNECKKVLDKQYGKI